MNANYNGKQPNNTSYVKNFIYGIPANLWKVLSYTKPDGTTTQVITTSSPNIESLFIKGDLFVDGNIYNPSDINLKHNINRVSKEQANKLLKLESVEYSLKSDITNKKHFGFIAQDFEKEFPELIDIKPPNKNMKAINYLELIPMLVKKIQEMQEEIDALKAIK